MSCSPPFLGPSSDVGLDVGRNLVGRRGSHEPGREKLLQWG